MYSCTTQNKYNTEMTTLQLLMTLLPIVFMIHDFEEIIMLRRWLAQEHRELVLRFPRLVAFLIHRDIINYSTATFTVGVAFLFLLISIITVYAVWQEAYQLWFAIFIGYSLHLLVHIIQWVVYRKYIPVIVTTILTLPYCVYTFIEFRSAHLLDPTRMIVWSGVGIILVLIGIRSAFFLMDKHHLSEKMGERSCTEKK